MTTTGNTVCNAAITAPGTYDAALQFFGNVANGTFSVASSPYPPTYDRVTYVAATPTPTPVPTATSTGPSPTPFPSMTAYPTPAATAEMFYEYIGEYATTSGSYPTTGCVLLTTTQNGQPLVMGSTINAGGEGYAQPANDMLAEQTNPAPTSGTITQLSITGLGPSSGSGTFTLDDGTTGTISITGRAAVTIQDAARRSAAFARAVSPRR